MTFYDQVDKLFICHRQNTSEIYKKISSVVPEIEWKFHAPIN